YAAQKDHLRHQQEHRDGDELVAGNRGEGRGREDAKDEANASLDIEAYGPRDAHREAHWRADRQQDEQRRQDGDDHHLKLPMSMLRSEPESAGSSISDRPVTSDITCATA